MVDKQYYRSIFISDLHLGLKESETEKILEFLKTHECDYLYLIGDIIDGWALKRKWHWDQTHTNIIRNILTKSKRGTKVYYISGNHDEFIREIIHDFSNEDHIDVGNITFCNEAFHETINGSSYWCIHGDMMDFIVVNYKWLAKIGDFLYNLMIKINYQLNKSKLFTKLHFKWSLSHFIKYKSKQSLGIIDRFEKILIKETKEKELDGVICGHIHYPSEFQQYNIHYVNCGDWIDTLSFVVENKNGQLEIQHYMKGQ